MRFTTQVYKSIQMQEDKFMGCQRDCAQENKIQLTVQKLQHLIENFDQEHLRRDYFQDNLKCKSLTQSYNICDN